MNIMRTQTNAANASALNSTISVRDLNFYCGKFHALKNSNLELSLRHV